MNIEVDGAEVHRQVFDEAELEALRLEAERVAARSKSICVRHLQERSEVFDRLAGDPRLKALVPRCLRPVRSILFDKTPADNWPVPWHQDLTIVVEEKQEIPGYGPWSVKDGAVHVQPPTALLESMATVRVHLDDATTSSGALWVVPGSHRLGRISSDEIAGLAQDAAIPCECLAGDVLVMSPLILHSSRRIQDANHRRVLHFEYACLEDLDPRLDWQRSVFITCPESEPVRPASWTALMFNVMKIRESHFSSSGKNIEKSGDSNVRRHSIHFASPHPCRRRLPLGGILRDGGYDLRRFRRLGD